MPHTVEAEGVYPSYPDTDSGGDTTGTDVGGNTIPPTLTVDSYTFADQTAGVYFSHQFTATGAAPSNLTWSVSSGTLPTGWTLNPNTGFADGVISGSGTFNFTLLATAGDGRTDTEAFTITTATLSEIILATSELWGYYPLQDDGSDLGTGYRVLEASGNNDTTPIHDKGNWFKQPSADAAPTYQVAGPGSIDYGVKMDVNKGLFLSNTPALGTSETYLNIIGTGHMAEHSVEICFKRDNLTNPGYDSYVWSHGSWIFSGTPQPAVNSALLLPNGSNQFYFQMTPRLSGSALAGPIVNDTDWHHIVCVHSDADSVEEIWFDGVKVASQGTVQVYSTALGGGPYTSVFGGLYYDTTTTIREQQVSVSQAAFYRKRLTQAEIEARFAATGL